MFSKRVPDDIAILHNFPIHHEISWLNSNNLSTYRGLLSGGLILGGFVFFFLINKGGERFLRSVEQGEARAKELAGTA